MIKETTSEISIFRINWKLDYAIWDIGALNKFTDSGHIVRKVDKETLNKIIKNKEIIYSLIM